MFSEINLAVGHHFLHLDRQRKDVFASVICRKNKIAVVFIYYPFHSVERGRFASFGIDFDKQLLVFIAANIVNSGKFNTLNVRVVCLNSAFVFYLRVSAGTVYKRGASAFAPCSKLKKTDLSVNIFCVCPELFEYARRRFKSGGCWRAST